MTETPDLRLKFEQLEKEKQIAQNSVPKIYRVPHHLRDREDFAEHYLPRVVSFGPIHHGARGLQLGEKYKLKWAAMYLERTKQDAQTLYQKIASNIEQLVELFAEDVIGDFPDDDEKLSWMLLVDGCSLLQILEKGNIIHPEEMNLKVDQMVLVLQDVLLLENQLPYQVLKLLSGPENEAKLLNSMNEFLTYCHHLSPDKPEETKDEERALDEERRHPAWRTQCKIEISQETPFHLLDQFRRTLLPDSYKNYQDHQNKSKYEEFVRITYRNIRELRATGIRVRANYSIRISDISFYDGWLSAELRLPRIIVDITTAPLFLNLIAFEMCPDFENNYEICSFVTFMGSFIDHADDVKELRSAGVLQNVLGSDEELAHLFHSISVDYVGGPDLYSDVRCQIEKYYMNKCRTWIALGYHTYFGTPGTIIAFYGAVVILVLTFIQTWCAIKQL